MMSKHMFRSNLLAVVVLLVPVAVVAFLLRDMLPNARQDYIRLPSVCSCNDTIVRPSVPLPHIDYTLADRSLEPLTYLTPAYYPYPRVRLVMETQPGTCNLFWGQATRPNPCDEFSNGSIYEPDPHVREAIATALNHCRWKPCHSVDLGANIGYMTAFMAALGSTVISVEPQLDLAEALKKTVLVNGWQGRVDVYAGLATMANRAGTAHVGGAFRFYRGPGLVETAWQAPFINVREKVLASGHHTIDLVKIDTDTIDGELIDGFIQMVQQGLIEVISIITEFLNGTEKMLYTLQRMGYKIYRLNVHMLLRHFNSTGHDILNDFKPVKLPIATEERYFVGNLKYALKLKNVSDERELVEATQNPICPGACTQFLITKLDLEEPSYIHPMDLQALQKAGRVFPARSKSM